MRCRALMLGSAAAALIFSGQPMIWAQETASPAATSQSETTRPSDATAALGETPSSATVPDSSAPPSASSNNNSNAPLSQEAIIARPSLDEIRSALAARLTIKAHAQSNQAVIAAFYALRDNTPTWIKDGVLTTNAKALMARMAKADEDGLDSTAYIVKAIDYLGSTATAEQIADADIAFSTAVLSYVRHAANGRVDGSRIAKDIEVANKTPDLLAALAAIVIAADPVATLEGYNPTHPQFLALKKKLAEFRANSTPSIAQPIVPAGPTLTVGMADARVAVLRTRLGVTLSDGDVYDEALADAVRSFQRGNNLKPTGVVNNRTLAALNGEVQSRRIPLDAELISNMERWRWMPRELGSSHVFVNVPQYKVTVVRDELPVYETKVIVGKPNTPTPIFSNTMRFVVFNPSWNVPQSIIQNEYLPKLAEDPDYLARRGFIVSYYGDRISVRQPPGDGNALGNIKFMFPNRFSVYLHDTSQRGLFANTVRAFSHGCVRVDSPYKFAEMVMGAQNGWTEDRVRKSVGGAERTVDLAQPLPVHLAYFTAYVDDSGELQQIKDIYGYDRRVLAALNLLR